MLYLLLGDHQRWRKANDVLVRGFGLFLVSVFKASQPHRRRSHQQTLRLEQHAKIPCGVAICLALVDDYRVEQALAADGFDHRTVNLPESVAEYVSELLCPLDHVFLLDQFQRPYGYGRPEWVSAVRRPVRARLDCEHYVFRRQHAG